MLQELGNIAQRQEVQHLHRAVYRAMRAMCYVIRARTGLANGTRERDSHLEQCDPKSTERTAKKDTPSNILLRRKNGLPTSPSSKNRVATIDTHNYSTALETSRSFPTDCCSPAGTAAAGAVAAAFRDLRGSAEGCERRTARNAMSA